MTEPAAFVVVKTPAVEPGLWTLEPLPPAVDDCTGVDGAPVKGIETAEPELPPSVTIEPTDVKDSTPEAKGVASTVPSVGEAGTGGTKAVKVLENVKAEPAEFVKVVIKIVLAVEIEGLEPFVELVSVTGTVISADLVVAGRTLSDNPPADVESTISLVTDVSMVDPEAFVVEYVKTVVDSGLGVL